MNFKTQMDKLFLVILIIVVSSSLVAVTSAAAQAIFTFGDSIFDAGNNHFNKNCTAQADFPPYGSSFFHHPTGRFTNGRTVPDFISEAMEIELQKPYLELEIGVKDGSMKVFPSNGINFASAGSGVLQQTNQDLGVTSLQKQLLQFQTLVNEGLINKTLIGSSMFFFESGSNDIFNYFLPFDPQLLDPKSYVQAMLKEASSFVDQIYQLGARRIALFSLGPVGCVPSRVVLPDAPLDRCYDKMNLMVEKYNIGLESLVKNFTTKYSSAIVVFGAVYEIVQLFRSLPSRYGFKDVSSACCGDGDYNGTLGGTLQCGKEGYKVCINPNEFLFWDYFHPSEHAYKLISKALWSGKGSRIRPMNLKTLSNITSIHHYKDQELQFP